MPPSKVEVTGRTSSTSFGVFRCPGTLISVPTSQDRSRAQANGRFTGRGIQTRIRDGRISRLAILA